MNKIIKLELKRNNIRQYNKAVMIITAIMLGMIYLMVAIPKIDPSQADMELMSYEFLININNVISMAIFIILSSVIYSKFVVEEYTGKKAILILTTPVSRKSIITSKIVLVFLYTIAAMFVSGLVTLVVFFSTESIFQICTDALTVKTIIRGILSLICYSIITGLWSVVALWFGFVKKSTTKTIIAAVIISVILCQILSLTAKYHFIAYILLVVGAVVAFYYRSNLVKKVVDMEV